MTGFYRESIDAALEAVQREVDTAESPDDIEAIRRFWETTGFSTTCC